MHPEVVISILEVIVANDQTPKYEYGEPRLWDGKHPGAGGRFNTPREIAQDEIRRIRKQMDEAARDHGNAV